MVSFNWNTEREAVFIPVKRKLTQKFELTLPNTKNFFFILVDASGLGVGTVVIQADDKGQMQLISYKSNVFTESEQKTAVIYRELIAIVYAVEFYDFLIKSSKHSITFFTDHKPILSVLARKGSKNPRFSRYQTVLTRFPKLLKFCTHGQKLCLDDLLSRKFSLKIPKNQQKYH